MGKTIDFLSQFHQILNRKLPFSLAGSFETKLLSTAIRQQEFVRPSRTTDCLSPRFAFARLLLASKDGSSTVMTFGPSPITLSLLPTFPRGGLLVDSCIMLTKTKDVVSLGKALALLPLCSFTLRAQTTDPFCNGIVLWPSQLLIASLVCFARNCLTDEYKQPSPRPPISGPGMLNYDFTIHAVTTISTAHGDPTLLSNAERETLDTFERALSATRASILCPSLAHVSWQERSLGDETSRVQSPDGYPVLGK